MWRLAVRSEQMTTGSDSGTSAMNIRLLKDEEKLAIGSLLGLLVLAATLTLSFFSAQPWSVNVALCLAGSSIGWLAGIFATPFGDDEKTAFTDLAKGFLALGTGFLLAKFDKIMVDGIDLFSKSHPEVLVLRLALFATSFVIGFLFTLIFRLYGVDEAERKARKLAKLAAEAKRACEKLAAARADA